MGRSGTPMAAASFSCISRFSLQGSQITFRKNHGPSNRRRSAGIREIPRSSFEFGGRYPLPLFPLYSHFDSRSFFPKTAMGPLPHTKPSGSQAFSGAHRLFRIGRMHLCGLLSISRSRAWKPRGRNELVRRIVIEEFGGEEGCPCNKLRVYTEDGRISFPDGHSDTQFEGFNVGPPLVMECGPACRCGSSCRNRVSQRGLAVRVAVVRHPRKGWGLHSLESIRKGAFVCEYAGELLTTVEARERQRRYDDSILSKHNFCSALLVIREHLPSGKACMRMNIDATKIGNVARFINHSCDGGNLLPTLVRCSGSILARLCFFASRDICEGEELTFCYGTVRRNSKMSPCFCNTPVCCGMLPSEAT